MLYVIAMLAGCAIGALWACHRLKGSATLMQAVKGLAGGPGPWRPGT